MIERGKPGLAASHQPPTSIYPTNLSGLVLPWLDQSEVELYGSSQSQAGMKELSGLRIVSAFQFLEAGRLILRLQVEF